MIKRSAVPLWLIGLVGLLLCAACRNSEMVPINELGAKSYFGYPGGLYPNAANSPPDAHRAAGLAVAGRITPLDVEGRPDPIGKIVFMSIGMSNSARIFCGNTRNDPACHPDSFAGRAEDDAGVDHEHLVIINGARAAQVGEDWDSAIDPNYDRLANRLLAPAGLSDLQVQVIWLSVANPEPETSLPDQDADAFLLLGDLGNIVRALKQRNPNHQQIYVSSRIYGGYATTTLHPEPYAYETGFSVKWLIEAQIRQAETGEIDPIAGDLSIGAAAPWLSWGPYFWAPGEQPRADGMFWAADDFIEDGTHPSEKGMSKAGRFMLEYFLSSEFARCWFAAGNSCGDG